VLIKGSSYLKKEFRKKKKELNLKNREEFEPEKVKNTPICMEQYKLLFSTCRVPGEKIDDESRSFILSSQKFIVVIRKDQFFFVQVYHSDGTPLSIPEIEWFSIFFVYFILISISTKLINSFQPLLSQMKWIIDHAEENIQPPVGIFTTLHRDKWGKVSFFFLFFLAPFLFSTSLTLLVRFRYTLN